MDLTSTLFIETLTEILRKIADGSRKHGLLIVREPAVESKEIELQKATVTFSEAQRTVVIHHGAETTHVVLGGWESVQYVPKTPDSLDYRTGRVLFVKPEIIYEIN